MSETSRFPDTSLQAGSRWATYATAAGDSGWFGLASWMSGRFQWCNRYGNRYTRRIRGWNPYGMPWAEDVACQDFKLEAETAMKIIEDRLLKTTETCSTLSVFQSLVKSYLFHQMFPVLKGSWMIECQFFLAFFVSPKFQPQPFLGKRWPWRIVSEEYASFGRDLGQIWRRVPWIRRIWRRLEKHGVSVEN